MVYTIILILVFLFFLFRAYIARNMQIDVHEGQASSVGYGELIATLLATAIGGGLIFGLIGFGQSSGIIGILLAVVYCVSFVALGMLAPSIRKACFEMQEKGVIDKDENLSLTLFLARKYNKITWGLITISYGLIYIGFLAAQYVAIAYIINGMGLSISFKSLVISSAAIIFLYISLAGYRAVLKSDVIQLATTIFIFLVGIVLIFWNGAPSLSKLPSSYWDPFANPKTTSNFVWLAVFIFPSLLLRIDHWQRIITAKNDKTATSAYITSGFFLVLVFITLLFIGAAGTIAGNTSPFYLYQKYLLGSGGYVHEIIYGIALAGFLCAVISSADTILNAGASALIQSFQAWRLIKTKKSYPIILVSLVYTIIAIYFAIIVPNVVPLITEGFKVMTILLPAIVAAIIYHKPNDIAASFSVIAGLISYILIKFLWQNQGQWGYVIGFCVALITLIAVYKIDTSRYSK